MIALVSGGFDPLHAGHLRMIEAATHYGEVVVVLNSDAWLKRKKGYTFMCIEERAYIINCLNAVLYTVGVEDDDDTICAALYTVRPNFFCNGGDRETGLPKEHETCVELGISELFNIGGTKIQSSSRLVENVK